MKKITLSICILALAANSWAQTLDRSQRPKAGPAPEIKLGKTETFTLANGMKVFVVENHKLPTVAFSIQLDVKPELEGDMTGYRDMMSELLTSGTKTRSKDKLNEEIDFLGASIDANAESIEASGLKKYQEKILELMSDITINADFKQEELDNIRKRALSGLEAEKNNPDAMLKNVSAATNFGTKHPYGEIATDETIKKITLDRCKKYYSTYFRPNVAYMAIVGDVTMAEIKPLIEKYFGSWQKATVPVATYVTPKAPAATRVVMAPRDGAVQSVLNVTYPLDMKPGAPDAIKARVANAILGDGSQGRLFLNLREKHGWTYGSYSSLTQDDLMGAFTAYAKCRNAVTDSSVTEILKEMKRLQTEKVDAQSLQNTIAYLSGSFAIGLESPERVAQYAINIERYHLPKDYYQNYLKNLAAVSAEDVQGIARKYITADRANIVVVGNKDEVGKKLAAFAKDGKVTYTDNFGREIKIAAATAAPANMTADAVYKKYVAAIGGDKALNGLKDIKMVSEGEIQGTKLSINSLKKSPDKLKLTITAMGMTIQQIVLNGDKGYQTAQGQKKEMTADEIAETKEDADLQAELHQEKFGVKRTMKGMEKLADKDVYVLEAVNAKGEKTTEYYEAATGYLVKEVKATENGPMATEFADYKEVPGANGYKMPYTVVVPAGPGMNITSKVTTVEVNKGIADAEFE
jgi:predicted Zn-dependent peptidase